MPSIGPGVNEIRVREEEGIFRVIYVAKFADAIYVLHCFQKKTKKTSEEDIGLARERYAGLLARRNCFLVRRSLLNRNLHQMRHVHFKSLDLFGL